MFDYNGLPEHMRDGLKIYVEHGVPPGSFMRSVLSNDLKEACARADHINRRNLWEIVRVLWNEVPSTCWGSLEKVQQWINAGGIKGIEKQKLEANPEMEWK